MSIKTFEYSLLYKLNFIPGILYVALLFTAVIILPSSSKLYGYLVVLSILLLFIISVIKEKLKIPKKIIVNNDLIIAETYTKDNISIKWEDVKLLQYSGKGLYLVSKKVVRNLYAEVLSIHGKKIIIRREIVGYDELIHLIEKFSGKQFIV